MAAPTAIRLSQAAINEREQPGGFVSILATADADAGDTFTYALVAGEGDDHNDWFQIQGNLLVNNRVVDRELLSSLSLRLRSTDSAGQSVEQSLSLLVNNLQDPVFEAGSAAISFSRRGGRISVSLSDWFVDPFSSGRIARFHLDPGLAATIQLALGDTYPELAERSWLDVVLFDQPQQGAPLTVANLARYVDAGRYADTFLHRLVSKFVLQGGGFVWPGGGAATTSSLAAVTTFEPLTNEFSSQRSNIRGTVAMAKLGNDPDSATSQWFFSLADNSSNLDNQNGGFSVFGRLRDGTDLLLMDVLGSQRTLNAGGVFSNLPLYKLGDSLEPTDVLRFREVEILQEPALQFKMDFPGTAFVQAQLSSDGVLNVVAGDANGSSLLPETAAISITATNLLGESVRQSFDVITNRWSADLDGDGVVDPFSDGLYIASAATTQSVSVADPGVDASLQLGLQQGYLDLDGNDRVDAVDAQLLLRFSFGTFPGASLGAGLIRSDDQATNQHLQQQLQVLGPLPALI